MLTLVEIAQSERVLGSALDPFLIPQSCDRFFNPKHISQISEQSRSTTQFVLDSFLAILELTE